MNRKRRL